MTAAIVPGAAQVPLRARLATGPLLDQPAARAALADVYAALLDPQGAQTDKPENMTHTQERNPTP